MDARELPGRGEPLAHRFISGGTQNEIYEIRRGELHVRAAHPAEGSARRRATRASCASGGSSRRSTAPTCRTPSHRRVRPTPACSAALLPDGLRRRLVADEHRRLAARPFDTDLDARRGLGLQLVEGIALLSKVDWRARGPRTTSAAPTASTSARSTAGRRSSSGSRGASSPASTRPPRGCGRTGRSTTSPA
jgi:hypothetical protein